MKQRLLLTIAIMIIATTALTAKTIYVKADATGSDNGTSWANAYVLLQSALEDAVAGDEIWVAAGTYKPTAKAGTGTEDRHKAFVMKAGVALYGGFIGTESTLAARQLPPFGTPSPTILSGDLDGDGELSDGDAYHVVISATDENNAGSIDGFCITGGNANNDGYISFGALDMANNNGAGMCVRSSSPTITNVTIINNAASGSGGGMYNRFTSVVMTNVFISNNTATNYGGGVYYGSSSATLTNVIIRGNSATDSGGGIYNGSSSPSITNITISENSAEYGGGMYNSSSSPSVTNCTISGNSANSYGGGMDNDYNSYPVFTNVAIIGNYAQYSGGGILNHPDSHPTFINVTISGNSAYDGGGMNNDYDAHPTLQNTIVWGNSSGIYNSCPDSNVTYHNCLVQDRNDASNNCLPASGINENAVFVSLQPATPGNPTTGGDYRLRLGSPVINLGDNFFNNTPTDLSGNPRIVDGVIDMGAYEYGSYFVITFHTNGGTPVENRYITEGGVVGSVECIQTGFILEDWYTDAAFTPSNIWNVETDPVYSDLDLYAKWVTAYTVTFNSNGGSEVEPIIVPIGTTIPQPESPIQEGYIFDGWYKEAALINQWNFETDIVETNITLYAKWLVACTVTFSSNGGSAVAPIIVPLGATITKPEDPELYGLHFAGWYKDAALLNIWDFDVDVVEANITLYAKWIVACTVTFNCNGGSPIEPIIVPIGTTIPKPDNPDIEGMDFDGWYKDAALLNIWDFDVDVVEANITLYAKWKMKGIDDIEINKFGIYPNPASENITITGIKAGDKITICELSGRKVVELNATAEVQTIDISSLSTGVYIINVGNGVIAGKLVVQ